MHPRLSSLILTTLILLSSCAKSNTRPSVATSTHKTAADVTAFTLGFEESPSGWIALDKNALQIQLCPDDQFPVSMHAIALVEQQKTMPLPDLYQRAASGQLARGHFELVGRMAGPYLDGDTFQVAGFIRKDNRIAASIQYIRGPQLKNPNGTGYDWKRAYFRASIPQNLPPGRYYVLLELSEYFRQGDRLIFAPKTSIRACEYLTCMFDVPDPAGKIIERLLPGSQLSITEALQKNFAFAAVCQAQELESPFQFANPGSNYIPGVFESSQPARVLELVAGNAPPDKVHIFYSWTDTAQHHETCLAKDQKVIWIVSRIEGPNYYRGIKAFPDTPENRQAIKAALATLKP